jgi:hypothetical protein
MDMNTVKGNMAEEGGKFDTPTNASPSEGNLLPAQAPVSEIPGSGCGALIGEAPSGGALEPMPGIYGVPAAPSYVYALGKIEPRFPSLGVEKEVAQAAGRMVTTGLTDREVLCKVLQENPYLSRQLCYVLLIQGLETYILRPTCYGDFRQLVEAICQDLRPTTINVVIGNKGPIAPPAMCNGLMVPVVVFDQIYSFDIEQLIANLPPLEGISKEQKAKYEESAEEMFWRIFQMADNAGATDEHRALNYLAVRYDKIYERTFQEHSRDFSLTALDVRPSRLSGVRKVFDVILSYTNRKTDFIEKCFVRVDVTEEWPFLVTKMSSYYDR